MAALDFPTSPTVGQEHTQNDLIYVWSGAVWNLRADMTGLEIALDRKVSVAGDNMLGWLGLPHGDPVDPHHATPKAYVDRLASKVVTEDEPPADPKEDALWYDTNNGGLYIYLTDASGSRQWVQCNGSGGGGGGPAAAATIGDVKSGFQGSDHYGWVKLNGRPISTLTQNQQSAAMSLGFTPNLPDATDAVPMQTGAALGAIAGSWNIAQANLPNVSLTAASGGGHSHTGTTSNAGAHAHDITYYRSNGSGIQDNPGRATDNDQSAPTTTPTAGDHNHTFTTSSIGGHTHPVSLGGSGTPLTPKHLAVNMFCFLGT
jgi:hypothetical protein